MGESKKQKRYRLDGLVYALELERALYQSRADKAESAEERERFQQRADQCAQHKQRHKSDLDSLMAEA